MENINKKALFSIGYGLYVLTAREDGKDNGCIVNVAAQVTDTPLQIIITINKKNLTHDMVARTGVFNVNMLTEETPMEVIEHYGFQSGHTADKFAHCDTEQRAANGVRYIPRHTNGYISGKVVHSIDLGTHTLFIAEVTEAVVLDDKPSLTYSYYQQHIKPKPQAARQDTAAPARWVCQVCGYVYEGDAVPDDFVCPWCKHGKSDFVRQS